ncbi:hypothetical protein P8935_04030 [Telmatobacter sp. DSM 110680]|uniref:DUF1700 domain-containing protein n=1 Tax=Telmatobacter sp. DSM 110680 TaxID=3036704 RepID=A0AAU7DN95_9BACT
MMTETVHTDTVQIDTYLASLRTHLGPMTLSERDEIVREISAHIRDSAEESGVDVETILARLGSAEELASQYSDGLLIRQASRSISPLKLMRGALRLATKGVSGVIVFFVGVIGYAIGGGMALSGMLKPILPHNTGMWVQNGHLVAYGTQFPAIGPPAHEVLGMWYIPLMLTAGSLTLLATTFVIRTSLRVSQRWQARLSRGA